MYHPVDYQHMARAIQLAKRGLYTTHPNPRVGCVLVNQNEIVGEGFHLKTGEPHAEINALLQAGARARGATAYVSLEPCCHDARTPPCTDALIKAGVQRVIAATEDPNPAVSGKGFSALRSHGIETQSGLLNNEAEALNPGFFKRMRRSLPWVRIKSAISLDGRTALKSGDSHWISSTASRRDVQFLRAKSSAVLTGIETVITDDPSLNVRLHPNDLGTDQPVRQPIRVVLDSKLRINPGAKLLTIPGECIIFTCVNNTDKADQLRAHGINVIQVDDHEHKVSLKSAMRSLAELEINEIQVEAGATLTGSFLTAGLVDEIVLYIAGQLLGDQGKGLFSLPNIVSMQDRIELEIKDIRQIDTDLRVISRPKFKE